MDTRLVLECITPAKGKPEAAEDLEVHADLAFASADGTVDDLAPIF
jgi:hypothetical protein